MAEVTVSFVTAAESGGKTIVELDSEMNIDTSGNVKKYFKYGETAYFRAFSPLAANLKAVSSDGIITEHGLGTVTKKEVMPFTSENKADTKYPLREIITSEWLGRSLGKAEKSATYSISSELKPEPDGKNGVAMLELSYLSGFKRFGITLTKKSRTEYPVLVYVFEE